MRESNELTIADKWLMEEIVDELVQKYGLNEVKARKYLDCSKFYQLLNKYPHFVHHEGRRLAEMVLKDNEVLPQ